MTVLEPLWLLLLPPLVWWSRTRRLERWRRRLRWLALLLVVAALCRPVFEFPRPDGTVVVVVDRSASMPPEVESTSREIIDRLARERGRDDRLAVVSFADRAVVETPDLEGTFAGFGAVVGNDQSDLATGLESALALLPPEGGRLLLVSDGRWTVDDPAAVATRAALAGVTIDYRWVERPTAGDLAIEAIDAPLEVSPGEGIALTAWVRSPRAGEVAYRLVRDGRVLAEGRRRLAVGSQRLTFQDLARGPGVTSYTLEVESLEGADDPVPENGRARFLVSTRGPRPVWVVSPRTAFAELLRGAGLEVIQVTPQGLDESLESLAGASAVVLENVAVDNLGVPAVEALAAWVEYGGGGLLLTGGGEAYAPGGYFRSALDPLLPVSMELRQEHRQLPLAIAVALDRSGSMAAPVGGQHTKMDLANLATVEVLELLERDDELAVIAVDSTPHRILPLVGLTGGIDDIRATLLSIDARGGGIYVYEALDAAFRELLRARAPVRHVLLFADAADAENPADYRQLLAEAEKSGITVSVVGLGTESDTDAELLREIAKLGKGRVFFTQDPHQLPRIFAQDTFVVARSSLVRQTTPWRWTTGRELVGGRDWAAPPAVAGYNLTYLRPGATLLAVTEDPNEAPMAAAWQAGLGRVVALTAEVDGVLTGDLARWPEVGDFASSLVRWVAGAGDSATIPGVARLRLERGAARVTLHLDPERADDLAATPRISLLRGTPGRAPDAEEQGMAWRDPDTLEAVVPLEGDDVALATVALGDGGSLALPPVRLPYNPELAPESTGVGHRTLEALARQTGGRQRWDVGGIWSELPRRSRRVEWTPWLALLAALAFLLEIFERRTGWISATTAAWSVSRIRDRRRVRGGGGRESVVARLRRRLKRRGREDGPVEAPSVAPSDPGTARPSPAQEAAIEPEAKKEAEDEGVGGALAAARRRARRRRGS